MTKGSGEREEGERNLREGEREKEREKMKEKEREKNEREIETERRGRRDPADGTSTTQALWRHLFKTKFSPPWS